MEVVTWGNEDKTSKGYKSPKGAKRKAANATSSEEDGESEEEGDDDERSQGDSSGQEDDGGVLPGGLLPLDFGTVAGKCGYGSLCKHQVVPTLNPCSICAGVKVHHLCSIEEHPLLTQHLTEFDDLVDLLPLGSYCLDQRPRMNFTYESRT